MAKSSAQNRLLMRLRRINGQVQGLARMVTERRPAMEIVMQVTAAEAALHGVARVILRERLETCLSEGFLAQDADQKRASIDEVMRVFAAMRPK